MQSSALLTNALRSRRHVRRLMLERERCVMARLESLQKMLADDPHDGFLLYALAMELHKLNRRDEAMETLSTLLAAQPETVAAYFRLGQWKAEAQDVAGARDQLRAGIAVGRRLGDDHAVAEMQALLDELAR